MVKTIIEVHMYSDLPEDRVEEFAANWVEEAGYHLKDGESFQLAKVEQQPDHGDPEGYWTIVVNESDEERSDPIEARVFVSLDEWHPPRIEAPDPASGRPESWVWDGRFWRSDDGGALLHYEYETRFKALYETARLGHEGSSDYRERLVA